MSPTLWSRARFDELRAVLWSNLARSLKKRGNVSPRFEGWLMDGNREIPSIFEIEQLIVQLALRMYLVNVIGEEATPLSS